MEIKTLASGSTGNAYLVGDGTTTLLLECGISMRELMRRSRFTLSRVDACLITHEHGDHARAVHDVMARGIPVYCSEEMCIRDREKADALETRPVMSELFDAKERIKELEARPVEVAVQEPDPAEVERRAGEKAREMTAMLQAQVRGMQEDLDDARKIIDSAESATYMAAAEFAVNAAQVLNGIRASFWAVAKELSDEDFSSAAAPLLEAANRIVDCEWDDDEEEQE